MDVEQIETALHTRKRVLSETPPRAAYSEARGRDRKYDGRIVETLTFWAVHNPKNLFTTRDWYGDVPYVSGNGISTGLKRGANHLCRNVEIRGVRSSHVRHSSCQPSISRIKLLRGPF